MTNTDSRGNGGGTPDAAGQTEDIRSAMDQTLGQNGPTADDYRRLLEEFQSANDRVLRAQAELENFRKRMRREVDEERRFAILPLVSELLPVLDNLDRAIDTSGQGGVSDGIAQGVKIVQAQFLSVLERNHCKRMGEVGEKFDPHRHQAIAQEPSDQYPPGTVTRVARHGYQLHERVVRPAEVLVSVGSAPPARQETH